MKNDFTPFKVGTIFNSLELPEKNLPIYKEVIIKYPSRLNAMALDPSKIATNNNLCYSPGEIIFKIDIFKEVSVKLTDANKIIISGEFQRPSLIKHSALIMKEALSYPGGFIISVKDERPIKHAGLGSSSGLIAAVACAINEIFGNPITPANLLKYLAQNHGEEIENDEENLSPVQCIGGSAAGGLYRGGMLILAGSSTVIAEMDMDPSYKVVIGIPKDFSPLDAQQLLKLEEEAFPNFINCGEKYGKIIAYRVLHEVLPAMKEGDINTIGNLIYDYRFKMGSIENCSYCYKKMPQIGKKLSHLKEEGLAPIFSISSVGPGFFAITKKEELCTKTFSEVGLETFISGITNEPYKVLKKIKI